ncbi:MAG TPA: cytochrome c [Spirochaetia bacterium]|nr:cytochrome c [Spirochaetia bacterium]
MSLLSRGTAGSIIGFSLLALPGPAAAAPQPAASPGQAIYERDCAHCHGVSGKGDGEESMYLTPPPQDFTTGILDKRSDDFLATVISKGGAAKGLSSSMPAAPKLSQADVKNVVAYIRKLGKAPPKKTN